MNAKIKMDDGKQDPSIQDGTGRDDPFINTFEKYSNQNVLFNN